MPPKITYIKTIYVNGVSMTTKSGAFHPGGRKKKFETGPAGVLGYRDDEVMPPSIKAKIMHTDDLDLKGLQESESLTVTGETTGGKMISLVDPLLVEMSDVGEDGAVDLTFHAIDYEEN